MATILSPVIATAASKVSEAVTTCPPRTIVSTRGVVTGAAPFP
jgi:hypothetical protein